MKRLLTTFFAFTLLLVGLFIVQDAPKKPIGAKQFSSSAQEVIEYTDESGLSGDSKIAVKTGDEIKNEDVQICVIGNATKSVAPDKAHITAVVQTLDMDMVKSKDDNFEIFNKCIDVLVKAGIAKENIVLDSYISYPSYDYNGGKTLVGYYSISTFSFDVENLSDMKKYIDTATENGVTSIRNIEYSLSNIDEVYSEVLNNAYQNAVAKAKNISGRDDLQVKKLKEEYVYSCTTLYKTYSEGLDNNNMIGNIDVQARVVVEFE